MRQQGSHSLGVQRNELKRHFYQEIDFCAQEQDAKSFMQYLLASTPKHAGSLECGVVCRPRRAPVEPPGAAAKPPGGAAQPPGGAAQPPGGAAQPPGGAAKPPAGAAQPPEGAAQPRASRLRYFHQKCGSQSLMAASSPSHIHAPQAPNHAHHIPCRRIYKDFYAHHPAFKLDAGSTPSMV